LALHDADSPRSREYAQYHALSWCDNEIDRTVAAITRPSLGRNPPVVPVATQPVAPAHATPRGLVSQSPVPLATPTSSAAIPVLGAHAVSRHSTRGFGHAVESPAPFNPTPSPYQGEMAADTGRKPWGECSSSDEGENSPGRPYRSGSPDSHAIRGVNPFEAPIRAINPFEPLAINPFEAPIRGVNPFAAPMAPPEPDTSEPATHRPNHTGITNRVIASAMRYRSRNPATHRPNHTRSTNRIFASAMRMRHRSQNVAMSQQSDDPVPAAQPSG
jgi:hypothetical protein